MPPASTAKKVFLFVTNEPYFQNLKIDEGNLKMDAKGSNELLTSWTPGDIALLYLSDTHVNAPVAYYTITNVQSRPDLEGEVEEYDPSSERPHTVKLDSGQTRLTMDLRRDAYEVVDYITEKPISTRKLTSNIKKPIHVRIRWVMYKFTINGENLQKIEDVPAGFPEIAVPAEGFAILDASLSKTVLNKLEIGTKNTPQKRKLVHLTADDEFESPSGSTSKKKKTTPAKTPTSDLFISPRSHNRPDFYDPSSPKYTKPTSTPSPSRGRAAKAATPSTPASTKKTRPASASSVSVSLPAATVLAIRADDGENFVLARVAKTITIRNPNDTEAKHTVIQIKWLIEGREESLRGCYASPNWPAEVEWGAVIKTHVLLRYDSEKDMYWLVTNPDELQGLV